MSGFAAMVLLAACVNADPEGLQVGQTVPEFTATATDGKAWKSSEHLGKGPVVIYFYPADMTGGCTTEACAYRDSAKKLKKAGVMVVGVSGDTVKNHRIFKKAHNLDFTLLADPQGKIAKLFGVPVRDGGQIVRPVDGKPVTLKRGATFSRWTFVIGPDGKVVYRDTKVNPAEDPANILRVVKKLKDSSESES